MVLKTGQLISKNVDRLRTQPNNWNDTIVIKIQNVAEHVAL